MSKFTNAEENILTLIYNGYLDYEKLAEMLFVSKKTILTHMANIREKTGCKNMAEIVYKLVKFDKRKGNYMNGQLIGELGKVFEKYGYNLIAIEKKNTDKEQVNITIEDNNGKNN
jgi:DNA-binding CsgD family transcriptional regulator